MAAHSSAGSAADSPASAAAATTACKGPASAHFLVLHAVDGAVDGGQPGPRSSCHHSLQGSSVCSLVIFENKFEFFKTPHFFLGTQAPPQQQQPPQPAGEFSVSLFLFWFSFIGFHSPQPARDAANRLSASSALSAG